MNIRNKLGRHNLLTYHGNNKLSEEKMQVADFKRGSLIALIVLAGTFSIHLGSSLFTTSYVIHSSGSIGSLTGSSLARSEIRAVFVHAMSYYGGSGINWNSVAQTCAQNGIDIIVAEAGSTDTVVYPSDVDLPGFGGGESIDQISPGVAAAHAQGLEFWVSWDVGLGGHSPNQVVNSGGGSEGWLCPTKQSSRNLVKALVEELVTKFDIDGFMFDYIRYDHSDMCYCSECRADFQEWLGETITNWSQFYPGGARHNEYLEWRTIPVNNLVKDMRDWMLAIKPDLQFSAAVFQYLHEGGLDYPTYWRMELGQDWAYWVDQDWLDWVSPMMYTTDVSMIGAYTQGSLEYGLGGPEGKTPLVPFLANAYPSTVDPNNFAQQINAVRANGGDGWIIWRYGGPGDSSGAPDIRNYLTLVNMPNVFSLKNIQVSIGSDVTITWITDLPATSKVEYSVAPLFNASYEYLGAHDFNYWDINHVSGTVVEDATAVMYHSITLTGLLPGTWYYYRVQSQDQSGIATSKVYTFEF